jgi:hypothetical protein
MKEHRKLKCESQARRNPRLIAKKNLKVAIALQLDGRGRQRPTIKIRLLLPRIGEQEALEVTESLTIIPVLEHSLYVRASDSRCSRFPEGGIVAIGGNHLPMLLFMLGKDTTSYWYCHKHPKAQESDSRIVIQ